MTLKLEVGKKYRNRLGKVRGPIKETKDKTYPFSDGSLTYTAWGSWHLDVKEDVNDLIEEVVEEILTENLENSMGNGCFDHGCEFEPPKGMGTNGGCSCLKHIRPPAERIAVTKKVRRLKQRHDEVVELANVMLDYIDMIPPDAGIIPLSLTEADRAWVESLLGRVKRTTEPPQPAETDSGERDQG